MLKGALEANLYLQKHLYEKGFLITDTIIDNDKDYPFYNNFNKTVIGKYTFWVHSGAKIYTFDSGNGIFFIIGHAYNPYTMQFDELDILKWLAKNFSESSFTDKISELTGVFIAGIAKEEEILFLLDASGMQYACYGTINGNQYITSHMRMVGDLCNLETDNYVKELVNYRWYKYMMGNYLPGSKVCFNELKRVVPNTYIKFKDGKYTIQRFYPNKEIKMCKNDEEYMIVIKEAARILRNTMRLISQKWENPAISLTGGIDSNTTFAAANSIYDKYSTFSYVSVERETIDAEKAKEISDKFNVKHITYNVPLNNDYFKDFDIYKQILRRNDGDIGNIKDAEVRNKVFLMQNDVCDVEVKSWVSETIRAYAYKYFGKKKFRRSLKNRNYTSLYKIFLFNRKLVRQTDKCFDEYIKETKLKECLFNYDETDFFVWENMHGGKCGLNIGVMKSCFDITIPYNNRKLLDLLLRVPLEYRINDKHHLDLKKELNEELYEMNIRVVNANQTGRRAKLLGVYYNLNSILPF